MIISLIKALRWCICQINLVGKHKNLLKLILKHWQNQMTEETLQCYETVAGSENFQAALFTLGSETFKASTHLFLCDLCVLNTGSCKLLKECEVIVKQNQPCFNCRCWKHLITVIRYARIKIILLYQAQLMPQLHSATLYTVWFIRMKKPCIAETFSEDDYRHAIVAGQSYIIGNFLEKLRSNLEGHYFKVDCKTSYFYHESFVYLFAQKRKIFHQKFWIFWNH